MNSRHPDPRRVLGRCRAAVRGQDPLDPVDPLDPWDPGMGSFLRVLKMKIQFQNYNFYCAFCWFL